RATAPFVLSGSYAVVLPPSGRGQRLRKWPHRTAPRLAASSTSARSRLLREAEGLLQRLAQIELADAIALTDRIRFLSRLRPTLEVPLVLERVLDRLS